MHGNILYMFDCWADLLFIFFHYLKITMTDHSFTPIAL